jgi:UDP-MurNAc hydroxylase
MAGGPPIRAGPSRSRFQVVDVQLISHASVVITTSDVGIWTDPWLSGTAFNGSWSLVGPVQQPDLERIHYIWISHEHPDHFHIPTLKHLPDDFKRRVIVLYQQNNSNKVFEALRRLGFQGHRPLAHRAYVELGRSTLAYSYNVGHMDSVLFVQDGDCGVLDINDAELADSDCHLLRRDIPAPMVVLNQFSLAGYGGQPERHQHLPKLAEDVLSKMVRHHRALDAGTTIPIASFVWFSRPDNRYMNEHANRPAMVYERFRSEGLNLDVLAPGEVLRVGELRPVSAIRASIEVWDRHFDAISNVDLVPTASVALDELRESVLRRSADLRSKYPRAILRLLRPLSIWVPDLGVAVRVSVRDATLEVLHGVEKASCDAIIESQPLDFALREPFGLQTLGVSARYEVQANSRTWRFHRIVFSLNNAEVYLKPTMLLRMRNVKYLARRARGGLRQIRYKLQRMG